MLDFWKLTNFMANQIAVVSPILFNLVNFPFPLYCGFSSTSFFQITPDTFAYVISAFHCVIDLLHTGTVFCKVANTELSPSAI